MTASFVPTHRRRLAGVAAVAGLAAVALTGCEAHVATDITVTGGDAATVHVTAVFTDEAADAIEGNAQAREQLLGVFSDRTGTQPTYHAEHGRVEVSEDLTYSQLHDSGALLGVSGARLSGGDSRAQLALDIVAPSKIADAVTTVTASQPDSAALASTMLKTTTVTVTVTFPGGIESTSVTGTGLRTSREGDTVVLTRTADSTGAGTWTVTGDPSPDRWPWILGGVAVLALGGGVLARVRGARSR